MLTHKAFEKEYIWCSMWWSSRWSSHCFLLL